MFFNKCQRLHEWKDTTYLYMYALIQVFIMIERFAVVEVVGPGAGTQFCKESGILARCEVAKLSKNTSPPAPGPQTLSCLAAANRILSPGEHFRERYT